MASFSFGAGNARKLARIPLYVLGRLTTAVVPRGRQWVFGSAVGLADGPLELVTLAAARGQDVLWLTDFAAQRAQADALGIRSVDKHSVAGFLATARAGVVVVSHGFGDANRYATGGALVAQLWHGIPLKRIGLDSPETVRSPIRLGARLVSALLARMFAFASHGIDVLPAASHLVRGRLESAFALDDSRVVVTGEPRVDVLSRGTLAERRAAARTALAALLGDLPPRLVLYAPTWRDGAPDPAVPSNAEWQRITAALDALDAALLVRSHPLGAGDYAPPGGSARVRLLGSDLAADVTPLLAAMDLLVTDYSSLAYDAALVELPVLYLAPDAVAYARRRGFYGRYSDVAGDDYAVDWDGAVVQLAALLDDPHERAARLSRGAALSDRVHAFRDGRNTERVYGEIVRRLGRQRRKGSR